MKKSELIAKIAEKTGLSKSESARQLDSFLLIIEDELAAGGSVELGNNIGKLVTVQKKARTGRNPSNGAEIQIPAHKKPEFKPSASLKERVRNA